MVAADEKGRRSFGCSWPKTRPVRHELCGLLGLLPGVEVVGERPAASTPRGGDEAATRRGPPGLEIRDPDARETARRIREACRTAARRPDAARVEGAGTPPISPSRDRRGHGRALETLLAAISARRRRRGGIHEHLGHRGRIPRQALRGGTRRRRHQLHGAEARSWGSSAPNGAGKTTTIRVLTGRARPTSGHASVVGHDVVRERERMKPLINLVFEDQNLYARLTGRENLELFAELYGVPRSRVAELLEAVGLTAAAKRKVKTYSSGMSAPARGAR